MPEESKAAPITFSIRIWELPPLILHPLSNQRALFVPAPRPRSCLRASCPAKVSSMTS